MDKPRAQLALTGGITKSYQRMHDGRLEQVGQYNTPHPAHIGAPAARGKPAAQTKQSAPMPRVQVTWNNLQAGQTVLLGGSQWKVIRTFVGLAGKPNKKGTSSGKSTGSGTSTGSSGKGVNTGGTNKATGSKTKKSPVTNELRNVYTGKRLDITLAPGFKVWVY
jgi:hypothetical protein